MLRLVTLGVFFLFFIGDLEVSAGNTAPSPLQVGVPNDSGGLIFRYLIEGKNAAATKRRENIELYPLQDCCTTSTEWALSGNRLDLAVLCPDAARRFLAKNAQFQNFGSLLLNADVLVVRPGRRPKKIAVSGKRDYQVQFIRDRLGASCEPVRMNYAVVPFAYERNLVDGAVVDITKAFHLKGNKVPLAGGEKDLVTHLLVGKKNIRTSPQLKELAAALGQAVEILNDLKLLSLFLQQSESTHPVPGKATLWQQMKVRFTLPEKMKNHRPGRE